MAVPTGERRKLQVSIHNQIVGDYSEEFISYLGTFVRSGTILPFKYSDWRYVPEHYKEQAWRHLLVRYDIPERAKDFVRQKMGTMLRNFKLKVKASTLKKYGNFDDAQCDGQVPADQWPELISIWKSERKKEMSRKNKENRRAQTMSHCAGRRSFAQIGEDMKKKTPGSAGPTRPDLFIITRTRRSGQPVDVLSGEKMKQLKQKKLALPPELREDRDSVDDTFMEVMGYESHGRVRCLGLGVRPKDMKLTKANVEARRKLKESQHKLKEEFQQQMADRESKLKEELERQMAEKLASMQAAMQAEIQRLTSDFARGALQSSAQLDLKQPSSSG